MTDLHQAWLLLIRCPGLGSTRILKLINHFGNAEAVFSQKVFRSSLKSLQNHLIGLNIRIWKVFNLILSGLKKKTITS